MTAAPVERSLRIRSGRGEACDALRGRDMLCFSHDWSGDPLSKTHLMRLLARENRVLWVNSIGYRAPTASRRDLSRAIRKVMDAASPLREVEPNLHVLSPLVIPAYGHPWVREFNRWFLRQQVRRAMRRLGFANPVNWVFNPAASLIAGSLDEELLVYYCVDEYAAFSGVPAEELATLERELLQRADLTIVSSERLLLSKAPLARRAALVRHGVDWRHFRGGLDGGQVPAALAAIDGPILGYFGLIAQDWVDTELIAHVARSMPEVSIAMLGKITMDVAALRRLPNVHLLGRQPYADLPAFCRGFEVGLIPFPINGATLHANPLKVREYLAAGLPVISTPIPEVEVLGSCRIGRDRGGFVDAIRAALDERRVDRERGGAIAQARSDGMRTESWEARLEEIRGHVADMVSARPDDAVQRRVA
jgi:glycosyltransferase involved in cell wall biosynthesis